MCNKKQVPITGTLNEIMEFSDGNFRKAIFHQLNRRWARISHRDVLVGGNIQSLYNLNLLLKVIEEQNATYKNYSKNPKIKETFLQRNALVLDAIKKLIKKKEEEC